MHVDWLLEEVMQENPAIICGHPHNHFLVPEHRYNVVQYLPHTHIVAPWGGGRERGRGGGSKGTREGVRE